MAKAPILGGSKTVDLDDGVFGAAFNGPLVHEVVMAELAARRRGTHATKKRGLVSGGGAKPYRQNGTGRPRPEGPRPRPPGLHARPALRGRRRRVRPEPAPLHRQGQPQGPPRRAPRRAVGPRRPVLVLRPRRRRLRRAVDEAGVRADRRPPRRLGP